MVYSSVARAQIFLKHWLSPSQNNIEVQGGLAVCLKSSEKCNEFVAVNKEFRDVGMPASVEILFCVVPFPLVFFLISIPLKFCFVYIHLLDSLPVSR